MKKIRSTDTGTVSAVFYSEPGMDKWLKYWIPVYCWTYARLLLIVVLV